MVTSHGYLLVLKRPQFIIPDVMWSIVGKRYEYATAASPMLEEVSAAITPTYFRLKCTTSASRHGRSYPLRSNNRAVSLSLVEPAPHKHGCDADLLYLDSTAGKAPAPGIAHHAFHRVFLGVAIATVYL